MTALDADLLAELVAVPTEPCEFAKRLGDALPTVEAAFDQGVSVNSIVATLKRKGLTTTSTGPAYKHLRGGCRCPKT